MSTTPILKLDSANQKENAQPEPSGLLPLLTIFTIPKPFSQADIARIQANAIRSWQYLDEPVDVLLLGGEEGVDHFAAELGVRYESELKRNRHGTPLISDAFQIANQTARTRLLMYCNADVILSGQVVGALRRILESPAKHDFLAMGHRTDIALTQTIPWDSENDRNATLVDLNSRGRRAPIVCKEYFAFPVGKFQDLPHFAVGRGNWDNWLVSSTRRTQTPVINVSHYVRALHQLHGYSHLSGSRWQCYVSGEEARENETLAGGKCLISGAVADWVLRNGQLRRNPLSSIHADFWWDLPRFLALIAKLPFQR